MFPQRCVQACRCHRHSGSVAGAAPAQPRFLAEPCPSPWQALGAAAAPGAGGTEVPLGVLFTSSSVGSCGFGRGFLTTLHVLQCCGLEVVNVTLLAFPPLLPGRVFFSSPQVLPLPSVLQVMQAPDTWALSSWSHPRLCSEGEHGDGNWGNGEKCLRVLPFVHRQLRL